MALDVRLPIALDDELRAAPLWSEPWTRRTDRRPRRRKAQPRPHAHRGSGMNLNALAAARTRAAAGSLSVENSDASIYRDTLWFGPPGTDRHSPGPLSRHRPAPARPYDESD